MVTKVAPPPRQETGPLGPIQVIPPGLVGLLQLKQLGRLPDKLSDIVAPVIELRDWYLTQNRQDQLGLFQATPQRTLATGAQGVNTLQVGGVNAIVPKGQIWYVEQFNIITSTNLAADVVSFGLGIANQATSVFIQTGPTVFDVVTARQRFLYAKSDRGFWAYPGDVFCVFINDISTAGVTFSGELRATACPI